jgi:hypothetical protein
VSENQAVGFYSVNFSSKNLSTGVYFYRLNAIDNITGHQFTSVKKMVLVK